MPQVIYCPGPDKWVSLEQYVRAVKLAKANPDAEFKTGLTTWWPTKGDEIMRQFRRGLHDRINQGIRYSEGGEERHGSDRYHSEPTGGLRGLH